MKRQQPARNDPCAQPPEIGVRWHEQFGYAYDGAWDLSWRTNNDLRVQFQVNNLNQLSTASRSGTLTVAGNVTQGSAPYTVSVSGPGLSAAAAEVYADGSWARQGATPNNGQSTYTVTASDSQGRTGAGNITVNLPTTVSFTYDSRGNLTGDGQRVFEYDYENQLTNVYVAGSWRSEFKYDGLGRRRIRREYSWSGSDWGSPTNEVHYLYDGMVVIQERNNANTPQVTYTRGNDLSGSKRGAGGIGGLLARTASGANAYYHADANGNITCLIDASGNVTARYSYDPFGNLLWSSGTLARANLYRFSSKEAHPNSGLYYYGFRFYEPNLQRWVNRDPLGEWAGANLFQFVRNDPNNRVDLNGLCEPKPGDAPLILNLLAFVLGRGALAGKVGVPARIGQGEAIAARNVTTLGETTYNVSFGTTGSGLLDSLGLQGARISNIGVKIDPSLKGADFLNVSAHESFHVAVAQNFPNFAASSGRLQFIGAFPLYAEEVAAYGFGAVRAGQYGQALLAPVSAFQSLSVGQSISVLGTGAAVGGLWYCNTD